MALLVGGGIVAAFGKYITDYFVNKTTIYTCTIHLKNGPAAMPRGVAVTVDTQNRTTDDEGDVTFQLKKNTYKLEFTYANQPHSRNFNITKDSSFTMDIGKYLSDPKTGKEVTSSLSQPNKKAGQRMVLVPANTVKVVATQPATVGTQPAAIKEKPGDSTPVPIAVKQPTANEILQRITLSVRIDYNDSYGNRGKQFAYHYFLEGDKKDLDLVKEAMYQRNDPSFPEFKNHQYNVSDDRNSGFEYIGYQWGNVSNTYVQIVLANGAHSDSFLKTIYYK